MNLKKKIAISYLKKQYKAAKKYLETMVARKTEHTNIELYCDRVRTAGMAYAQVKFREFTSDGIFIEDMIDIGKDNNGIINIITLYKKFIEEMERDIFEIIYNIKYCPEYLIHKDFYYGLPIEGNKESLINRIINNDSSEEKVLLFGRPCRGKKIDFIFPLIKNYPDKVIYISSRNEIESYEELEDVSIYAIDQLPHITNSKKIHINMSCLFDMASTENTAKMLEFIEKFKDDNTLVIFDESLNVLWMQLINVINNAPRKCIIVLQDPEQLLHIYKEMNKDYKKDLKNNHWSIHDMVFTRDL